MALTSKRGLVRIMEVMIAITLLSGVVLYVFASQQVQSVSFEDYVYNYQREILDEISNNPLQRVLVLPPNPDEVQIENNVRNQVPQNLNFSIRVCGLNESVCNLENDIFEQLLDRDVYVLETFVASDGIGNNQHKKVRVFMWEEYT